MTNHLSHNDSWEHQSMFIHLLDLLLEPSVWIEEFCVTSCNSSNSAALLLSGIKAYMLLYSASLEDSQLKQIFSLL